MQRDAELKEKTVTYEGVKISRIMQALKKSEKVLRSCASKLKAKEEELQHMFWIYPYIYVYKHLNEQVAQLEERERGLYIRDQSLQGAQNCIQYLSMKINQKYESVAPSSNIKFSSTTKRYENLVGMFLQRRQELQRFSSTRSIKVAKIIHLRQHN